jgi:hypothetical protein
MPLSEITLTIQTYTNTTFKHRTFILFTLLPHVTVASFDHHAAEDAFTFIYLCLSVQKEYQVDYSKISFGLVGLVWH